MRSEKRGKRRRRGQRPRCASARPTRGQMGRAIVARVDTIAEIISRSTGQDPHGCAVHGCLPRRPDGLLLCAHRSARAESPRARTVQHPFLQQGVATDAGSFRRHRDHQPVELPVRDSAPRGDPRPARGQRCCAEGGNAGPARRRCHRRRCEGRGVSRRAVLARAPSGRRGRRRNARVRHRQALLHRFDGRRQGADGQGRKDSSCPWSWSSAATTR